jgi:hypothetical protein
MKNAIKILFYVRKSKTTSDGLTPIYMRVTIDNSRFESATGRTVVESKWSRRANRIEGNSSDAKELNQFLNALRAKAFDIQKTIYASKPLGFTMATAVLLLVHFTSLEWRIRSADHLFPFCPDHQFSDQVTTQFHHHLTRNESGNQGAGMQGSQGPFPAGFGQAARDFLYRNR